MENYIITKPAKIIIGILSIFYIILGLEFMFLQNMVASVLGANPLDPEVLRMFGANCLCNGILLFVALWIGSELLAKVVLYFVLILGLIHIGVLGYNSYFSGLYPQKVYVLSVMNPLLISFLSVYGLKKLKH